MGELKRKEYFCPECGLSKGLLITKKVDGIDPGDRPCKKCRNKKISIMKKGHTPWNKGVPMLDEVKEKLRIASTGQIAWNKGLPMKEESKIKVACSVRGISVEDFDGFKDKEDRRQYKEMGLSKACLEKADFTCAVCSERGAELNAHHMNGWATHPEDRYSLDNLVCVCHKCHRQYHTQYGNGLKEPNTKEQFQEFLRKAKHEQEQMDEQIDS
jgi:hypothetical protein